MPPDPGGPGATLLRARHHIRGPMLEPHPFAPAREGMSRV